ncbi:MAG: HEAT repeat domain-containing protein [Anaerolineae bacterium]|nr:HEAT repeat domain-containing protein [Phycisphaerae bacterium]
MLLAALGTVAFVVSRFVIDHTLWGRHRTYRILEDRRIKAESKPSNAHATEKLIDSLLHGRTSFERTTAASQLGRLGSGATPAIAALITSVEGPDLYVAPQAAMALGNIGPDAAAAVPTLIRMMRERADNDTGWLSAEALGKIARPDDADARAVLERASESENVDLAQRATFGLQRLNARAANTSMSNPPATRSH